MNREVFRLAFGGPNVITRWTFFVTFPLGLLAGTLWGIRSGIPVLPWFLVVVAVQSALLVPIWVVYVALRRARLQGLRPWLGFSALGVIGAVRTGLILPCANFFDVPISLGYIIGYLPYGFATGVVFMGIVAVIVDRSREHRLTMQNLVKLDAAFNRAREFDESEFARIEQRVTQEIQQMLSRELTLLTLDHEMSSDRAAAALRELAKDVVRPLSHRFADESPWLPADVEVELAVPLRERWISLLRSVRPAPPLVPALLILVIALPDAVASRHGGLVFAVFNMLLGVSVMYGLSWLFARFWPKGDTGILRLVILVVAYAGFGAIGASIMSLSNRIFANVNQTLWIAVFMLLITSLGTSLFIAIEAQRKSIEEALVESVERNGQVTVQLRERSRLAQRRIAKFLHSDVQAELIAVAMVLSKQVETHSDSVEVQVQRRDEIDRLNALIGRQINAAHVVSSYVRERITDLISLWDRVLTLDINIPEQVWDQLDQHPTLLEAVSEVLSEGLTNAVRHGTTPEVELSISDEANALRIDIFSTGSLPRLREPGLGSQLLAEYTREWSLTESGNRVHFMALVPQGR